MVRRPEPTHETSTASSANQYKWGRRLPRKLKASAECRDPARPVESGISPHIRSVRINSQCLINRLLFTWSDNGLAIISANMEIAALARFKEQLLKLASGPRGVDRRMKSSSPSRTRPVLAGLSCKAFARCEFTERLHLLPLRFETGRCQPRAAERVQSPVHELIAHLDCLL
jgi:hypothetical protein